MCISVIIHNNRQESEKEQLKNKAVRNVRLFADIYDRYGDNPTDEQLRLFLREKAEVEISKEGKTAEEVTAPKIILAVENQQAKKDLAV